MFSEKERAYARRTKEYLRGKTLKYSKYHPTYPQEHTFCVFCWSQISAFEEDLHEGYTNIETKSWVCELCLEEFEQDFAWIVDRSEQTSSKDKEEDLFSLLVI